MLNLASPRLLARPAGTLPAMVRMVLAMVFFCHPSLLRPTLATATATATTASATSEESPFWIIIDGGSTGSRLHVFEFVETTVDDVEGDQTTVQLECVRRGSARANVPLSAFAEGLPSSFNTNTSMPKLLLNATHVAEHLLPAFRYAAQQVPEQYHLTTNVFYQATAGMRLLTEQQQEAVYDALYQGLMDSPDFVFRNIKRQDISTLSGEQEGFYGAVAANYLKGTIDAHMELIPTTVSSSDPKALFPVHHGPIGALDMGGSSTQIVFLPGRHLVSPEAEAQSCKSNLGVAKSNDSASSTADHETCHPATLQELPSKLNGQDFFATSYLSYGVDQFRERLWTTWVQEHRAKVTEENCCDSYILENPCTFKGYEIQWHGYTLVGTGDAHACVEQVKRLLPHAEEPDHHHLLGSHVGGVSHPPVHGKFFAMSLYFFTLDSLRELSHPSKEAYDALNLSWPNPSIEELYNALDGLCSRTWQGDLEDIAHTAHAYTRAEVLPHRCLESVYMVTLLRDGFGFAPQSRDITFTFLVDGSEVEWSLGMALALRAQQQEIPDIAPTAATSASTSTIPADQDEDEASQECSANPNATSEKTKAQQTASSRMWEALSLRIFTS